MRQRAEHRTPIHQKERTTLLFPTVNYVTLVDITRAEKAFFKSDDKVLTQVGRVVTHSPVDSQLAVPVQVLYGRGACWISSAYICACLTLFTNASEACCCMNGTVSVKGTHQDRRRSAAAARVQDVCKRQDACYLHTIVHANSMEMAAISHLANLQRWGRYVCLRTGCGTVCSRNPERYASRRKRMFQRERRPSVTGQSVGLRFVIL